MERSAELARTKKLFTTRLEMIGELDKRRCADNRYGAGLRLTLSRRSDHERSGCHAPLPISCIAKSRQ